MTCVPLPNTGLGAYVGPLLVLALVCLVVGVTLVLMARRGRGAAVAAALLVLLGATGAVALQGVHAPAQAVASSGCSSAGDNRLSVTQTSSMEGLAPGVAPAAITGLLVNHSDESTYVGAVDVAITGVTPRSGSVAGACGTSDYRLIGSRMQVDRRLGPGRSAPFAGASIGFNNMDVNQDACQGASIQLRYTANPR